MAVPEHLTAAKRRAWGLAAVAAATTVLVDQGTKQIVVHSLGRGERHKFFLGVDIVNVRNTGIAFGALSGAGLAVTLLTIVAVAALLVYFALRAGTPLLWLPVGVIVGGAAGNFADRIRLGAVVDFIDPVLWPAFNMADAAIVLGILGLLYVVERKR
jgi:signal peptidase II